MRIARPSCRPYDQVISKAPLSPLTGLYRSPGRIPRYADQARIVPNYSAETLLSLGGKLAPIPVELEGCLVRRHPAKLPQAVQVGEQLILAHERTGRLAAAGLLHGAAGALHPLRIGIEGVRTSRAVQPECDRLGGAASSAERPSRLACAWRASISSSESSTRNAAIIQPPLFVRSPSG